MNIKKVWVIHTVFEHAIKDVFASQEAAEAEAERLNAESEYRACGVFIKEYEVYE